MKLKLKIMLCVSCIILLSIPTHKKEKEVKIEHQEVEIECVSYVVPIKNRYCPEIPLSENEQIALFEACDEFKVNYALALSIINQETKFNNIIGDHGRSYGYMQIQPRWWKKLMNQIGAYDLLIPKDNFRTGCAIISTLFYDKYNNMTDTLTAYNTGHKGDSKYARDVLYNMKLWQNVLDKYNVEG